MPSFNALVGRQFQFDLRIARPIAGDEWHHDVEHEGRGGIHPQPPRRPLATHRHVFLGLLHGGDDMPRALDEADALLGQLQPAGRPLQQGGLKLLLQAAETTAHRRYGLPQLRGGA
jgi:hypothetical protein